VQVYVLHNVVRTLSSDSCLQIVGLCIRWSQRVGVLWLAQHSAICILLLSLDSLFTVYIHCSAKYKQTSAQCPAPK